MSEPNEEEEKVPDHLKSKKNKPMYEEDLVDSSIKKKKISVKFGGDKLPD